MESKARPPAGAAELGGELTLPGESLGVVAFAHAGEPGDEHHPGNHFIAGRLQDVGLASLSVDLTADGLPARAERPGGGEMLASAVARLHERLPTAGLPAGTLGIGPGGAAALEAAALRPELVHAVLCGGGHPERLEERTLAAIRAPVMLIVGDRDPDAIRRSQKVIEGITGAHSTLEIIAGIDRSLADPGAVELIADLAQGWFRRHLGSGVRPAVETAGG
jgi:putative phosphoribosyl transferase